MSTDAATDDSIGPPGLGKLLLEARAPFEYAASLMAAPWLLSAPRGDGHAVLVYPGLMASDFSTRPLRRLLQALGHDARSRKAHGGRSSAAGCGGLLYPDPQRGG